MAPEVGGRAMSKRRRVVKSSEISHEEGIG
jgi:hypothetical protein